MEQRISQDDGCRDLIMPADNTCGNVCEVMRIIGINGTYWAVARGVTHAAQNHTGTSRYGMVCATNLVTSGGPVDVVGWNFSADPHGTEAGVVADATDIFDHGTDSNTAAAGGDVWNCPAGEASCVRIKAATSPAGVLESAGQRMPCRIASRRVLRQLPGVRRGQHA